MKIRIISFTRKGAILSQKLKQSLADCHECILYTKCVHYRAAQQNQNENDNENEDDNGTFPDSIVTCVKQSTVDWAACAFREKEEENALLFIGACGIAVRSIAPLLRDKLTDCPVLVMDEEGNFVIPILSGHFGGANELARQIAQKMGAVSVITTATDINHLFAVDVFAKKNGLTIADKSGIAKVSSAILEGKTITMTIDGTYGGNVPKEVQMVPYPPSEPVDVLAAVQSDQGMPEALHLIPKSIVLGMGCRKGKQFQEIDSFVREELQRQKIPFGAICALATIDRKKEEQGLLAFAEKYRLPFLTFSKEVLSQADGTFQSSGFVLKQMGVDNVCERAAVTAAGAGCRLRIEKSVKDGMTLAAAEKEWSVNFDET